MHPQIGLGFRRDITAQLLEVANSSRAPSFVECAPENWINVGGYWGKRLKEISEAYPLTCHGLSLSIGGPTPIDMEYLGLIKQFLDAHNVTTYSEHISYSTVENAHLHELLPIPFRSDAVTHIANRIRMVQDFLERKIALENVSYYTPVAAEMDEATFINAILSEADCELLLDVNNVYVNAFNHDYNALNFVKSLNLNKVKYIHMAGHEKRTPSLIIDTHGAPIIDEVYRLFEQTCTLIAPVPVLLERDFNLEDVPSLLDEVDTLRSLSTKIWEVSHVA